MRVSGGVRCGGVEVEVERRRGGGGEVEVRLKAGSGVIRVLIHSGLCLSVILLLWFRTSVQFCFCGVRHVEGRGT